MAKGTYEVVTEIMRRFGYTVIEEQSPINEETRKIREMLSLAFIQGYGQGYRPEVKNSESGFFPLPFMEVCRDDIIGVKEGRDDFEQWREKCPNLTDEQMQLIADKLSQGLMNVWHETLCVVVSDILEKE